MFLRLTQTERRELENLARGSDDRRLKRRAQALLEIDAGSSPQDIALRYSVARSTVYNWIKRGTVRGFTREALCDRPRSGRPRREFPRDDESAGPPGADGDHRKFEHLG